MKLKLLFSIIAFIPFLGFTQNVEFKVLPFVNATTSIKDGQIEAGPQFNWENPTDGNFYSVITTVRIPLTSKSDNVVQIDRFSSTWRGILGLQYTCDKTDTIEGIKRHSISGQFEYGSSEYKYYPTGTKANEFKDLKTSYAFELKYVGFFSKGLAGAIQWSPQFRLRYSYDWKASSEVGVVNLPNENGITTTTNLIIDAPGVKPTLSPALSLQIYPGKGSFSYSPTVYYDLTGKKGENNPFGSLNRLRVESWVFFYPQILNNPNLKIGITPFMSFRTAGVDDFNKVEYGGMVSIKFGSTFLQFF